MNLEDAILHANEVANQICGKCGVEHEQLARWLAELERLRTENASLRARLDKAVELPCEFGDTVYVIAKCENFKPQLDGTMWDSDGGLTETGYYCPYEGCCPFETDDCDAVKNEFVVFCDEIKGVHIEDDIYFCCEYSNGFNVNDFGKTVFLIEAEAQAKLEEMKARDAE